MITKETVFILGAGASLDFGLPLGIDLRNKVCRALEMGNVPEILMELGHNSDFVAAFGQELRYSGYRSVDAFLEHNPDFLEIGKQAIAAVLLPHETERTLFPPSGPSDNWYELLANHMGAGSTSFSDNCLSIITFNYDRSLEHYFARVLSQRFRSSLEEACSRFKSAIPVVHVHGTLGGYPATESDGLEYGATSTTNNVRRAAERIQVVSEVTDSLPTFDRAYELLDRAKRIYFFGFGFYPDNVRRLRYFEKTRSITDDVFIGGLRTGIQERDWVNIRKSVLNGNWSDGDHHSNIFQYLQAVAKID